MTEDNPEVCAFCGWGEEDLPSYVYAGWLTENPARTWGPPDVPIHWPYTLCGFCARSVVVRSWLVRGGGTDPATMDRSYFANVLRAETLAAARRTPGPPHNAIVRGR